MASIWNWISHQGSATAFGAVVTFVFGLTAVLIGALFNAHLNRRRDDRLRNEELKSVAAALYGEILLLREEIARMSKIVAKTYFQEGLYPRPRLKFDQNLLERNTLEDPILYPALASKLGVLPADLVLAVTRFHADYESVRGWLPRMVENEERGFSYSVLSLLEPAESAVLGVNSALRRFEGILGLDTPAPDPDVEDLISAMDMERQTLEDIDNL